MESVELFDKGIILNARLVAAIHCTLQFVPELTNRLHFADTSGTCSADRGVGHHLPFQ